MVINIPKVEPFTFQAVTAFMERKELADKLNEVIDALNGIGDVPEMQNQIEALRSDVTALQQDIGDADASISDLTQKVNAAVNDINSLKTRVSTMETTVGQHSTDISDLKGRMTDAEGAITTHDSEISTIQTDIGDIDNEITELQHEVIDKVSMSSTTHGSVQVTIHHEDGSQDTSAPIDLALVQEGGITLQTGATDRSFNLKVTLSDGSEWQTNDFVIPAGGGTEVSVTSIQIAQGSQDDMMKVRIGLSDGSFIDSNDWTVVKPADFGALKTQVEGQAGDITALEGRVQALEDKPSFALNPATGSTLGGVKIGANINVTADGTISVTFPDAPDLSPYITKSEASSTYATKTNLSELTGEMMNSPGNVIGMASSSVSGLMSNSDKSKLDGIANNANNYVLPVGGTAIGGVKNGGNVTIEVDGTMNINQSTQTVHKFSSITEFNNIYNSIPDETPVQLYASMNFNDKSATLAYLRFSSFFIKNNSPYITAGSGLWYKDTSYYVISPKYLDFSDGLTLEYDTIHDSGYNKKEQKLDSNTFFYSCEGYFIY